jgi:hypothetical protein
MDFGLSRAVSIEKIKIGTTVDFELQKETNGSFVIEALKPAQSHEQHKH